MLYIKEPLINNNKHEKTLASFILLNNINLSVVIIGITIFYRGNVCFLIMINNIFMVLGSIIYRKVLMSLNLVKYFLWLNSIEEN